MRKKRTMMSQTLESTPAACRGSRLLPSVPHSPRPSAGSPARPKLAADVTARRRAVLLRAIPETAGATRSCAQ
jgi:hypothetical protein